MPRPAQLPAPPRTPRWRAALRRRWLIGLLGGVLLLPMVVLAVVVLAVGGDLLPLGDDALDASHSIAAGEITAIAASGIRVDGTTVFRIDYRFRAGDGEPITGHSFGAPRPGLEPGASVRIEYLPEAPEISRVRGSARNPMGATWNLLIGLLAMPGFLLLLWWLRGVVRLRLLLGTGRATIADIVERKGTVGVNPPQWRVTFRFRDERSREHEGAHWVGQRSPLGRALATDRRTTAVIYDEGDPTACRLAHPDDFVA